MNIWEGGRSRRAEETRCDVAVKNGKLFSEERKCGMRMALKTFVRGMKKAHVRRLPSAFS